MGARGGAERGKRRNVYTGLVGQSFLLRRSSFVVPSQRRRPLLIKLFCATGRHKGRKERSRNCIPARPYYIVILYIVRRYASKNRCLSLVAVLYRSRITVSLLPRTSSAKWWCRWLDERSRRKKGGGSYETKLVVLFVVVHGVSIGPNKEVGTFLSPTIFPTHIIEGSRGALLGGELVLEECFGRERERSIFFSTSRVLQGDLSDTVVLIAVY